GDLEEPVAVRERKILLQQPVSLKRPNADWKQRLLVGEPDRLYRGGRQEIDVLRTASNRSHQYSDGSAENQLQELVGHVVAAGEIDTQAIELDLLELEP